MLELARATDREAVNALAKEVHALHVAWRPDIYEMVDELYPQERFSQVVKDRQLYVARIGDAVAGYVLLKKREYNWPGVVYRKVMIVDEFCVDEICRGQGIGTQMMMEARILAKAFGCTDMQLGVYPQNDEAVSFYQKCGFTIRSIEMHRSL